MHNSNIQKVLPLSLFNVIIIGTTFSYLVCASEGNFSLFKGSFNDANYESVLGNPNSWGRGEYFNLAKKEDV